MYIKLPLDEYMHLERGHLLSDLLADTKQPILEINVLVVKNKIASYTNTTHHQVVQLS